MADLITVTGSKAKIEFDRVRILKPRHRYIKNAVLASGKPLNELLTDPFGGVPYVLLALLEPALPANEKLTLDKVSDLIDDYYDKGGTPNDLQDALVAILADYIHLEIKPRDDEKDDDPNAQADLESA